MKLTKTKLKEQGFTRNRHGLWAKKSGNNLELCLECPQCFLLSNIQRQNTSINSTRFECQNKSCGCKCDIELNKQMRKYEIVQGPGNMRVLHSGMVQGMVK